MVRKAKISDAESITTIYNWYIENTVVTFDLETVSPNFFSKKINSEEEHWLVYEKDREVVGYACAVPWKLRRAYQNSVEVSIYLNNNNHGAGIGSILYSALIDHLRELNYHAAIGGVALPNEASIRLHEKLGFKKVAHFMEVGYKHNRWIDVAYWQLLL